MNTLATVVTLTGRAWAVAADGQRRELQVGDRLRGDEMLVTEPGARVDLDFGNNQLLTFLGEQQQPVAEVANAIQAELPPTAPRPAAEERQQPQAQPAPASGEPEGHNFVQLVRINEIIEADGITPLTVARIQEVLRPLGMSLPERVYDLDEWREHRGGDERYEDAPAARHPGLSVELQGAGPDGIYSEAEIGPDGTVPAEVTLDDKVRVGDRLVIKDGKGNTLLDRPVTQDDLDNGVTVEVPVAPGDRNVTVEATVTTPRGYTGQDRDDKPVDNLPPDEVTILPPQDSEDAEPINLDLGSYFEDNVDGKDLTYDVTGLPPGLSFDPDTGIITGTIDRSASQGGPDDDGVYKVTVTITDKVGNQTTIDFDWTVTNPEPEARDDRQTIDEDTVATGNVLTGAGNDPGVDGSDSDPDGDDLTVTSFTIGNDPTVYPADGNPVSVEDADGNVIGEITLNENGDYSFTPVPDWNGSVPDIHYTISDGEGGEDEARLSITVAPVNDPVELENVPDPNDPNDPSYPAVNDPTDPNDPARGNANDHVVFESALPGGSDQSPNQADLKVESSFTINAPDGLHGSQGLVLTYTNINGESRTLNLGKEQIEQLGSNNQTVDTQYGKLVLNGYTLNADGTISIDYEYTLERAPEVGGDHVDDRINIAVRDSDAHHPSDTDSKDLVIRIIDDAPVARDDANSIDEDTAVPVTGNVIANGSTGDVADTQGADGATVTGVTAGDQSAGGHVADGGVAGNIVGDYGTLVLNADGSYSYQLDNSNLAVQGLHPDDAPLTDTFTYTITDADGDQSTATLTITVNGSNDGVTVTVPDPNDPADPNYPTVNDPTDPNDPARGNVNDHVVFESGLSGGSATDVADTRVVSSFTLSALDGLDDTAAITIEVAGNTLTLSKAEVEDLVNNSQSIPTEYGELVLNGYTPNADGTITIGYEYTLTSAPDNSGGNGVHTDDTIRITVNDRDTDSDSQDLVIRIIDDAPVARDDTNQVDEDVLSVDGNVITSSVAGEEDTVGADGATVTGVTTGDQTAGGHVADGNVGTVISGQYGDLTLNADGSYSYQLDNSNLVVQGLTDGDTLTETFTYTITDADGDQSTATLTITVNGADDGVSVDVPVNDGATTPDGNVNDHVVFESGLTNGSAPNPNDLKVESSFTLVALDGLATSGAVELTFTNTNGNTQTLSLSKEQVEQLGSTPVTLITQYGELVLNGYSQAADGTITIVYEYTLQRAPEVDAVDVRDAIGIKVTDRDGDQDDSQSINIKIVDDAPVARDDTNQITEDAVSVDGNVITSNVAGEEDTLGADGATVTGVTAGDQTAGGHVADGGVAGNIVGDYGTLVLNADGSYSYQLDNSNLAVQGLHPDDAPLTDVFTYTITDADGDQSTATLTISVNGANDGVTVTVPDPNDPADPNYPTVNDPTDPNDPARGNVNDHVVFESGLAGGSATNADDTRVVSSFTLSALDGLDDTAAITIEVAGNTLTLSKTEVEDLLNNNQSITTEYGELVLNGYTPNADGSITIDYEYTLTSAPDNTGGNGLHTDDTIRITVNDRDTDSDSQDLVIRIIDDAPVARDDANEIDEDELSVIGNVITGGSTGDVADTEGADGATVTAIVSDNDSTSTATTNIDGDLVIVGEFGTLTISPDGSYTYELNNDNAEVNALKDGETLTEQFSYTLTDIDGDSDTAQLTITINGNNDGAPTIVPEDVNGPDVPADITTQGHVTVHERGLTGADSSHVNDGSVTITAPDGLQSITVGGVPVDLAQLAALDPADPATHIEIDTPQGKLTLTGFDVTDSVGGVPTEGELQFTYELEQVQTTPADPADPDAGRNSTETIPLEVTDAGGETGTGDLVINIIDDVPVAVDDTNVITEDQLSVTGNVIGGPSAAAGDEADTLGADGATVTEVSNAATGSNMTTLPNGDLVIEGQYGTLTIRPDGFYTYELDNSNPDVNALKGSSTPLQDVFTYTLTDGDGDSDSADLTITINGNTDGAPTIVPEDVNGPDVPADITTQGHVTVHERGLTGADSTHINDGSVTITAADGLQSITVGGVPVDLAQLAALDPNDPATHIEIDTPQGKLTLTGFDVTDSVGGVPTEGELQFTYELEEVQTTPADPADPDAGRNSTETIPLIVTDAGGETGTGDLVINIIDDVPVARDDAHSIDEDETSVTGNVITGGSTGDVADTEGADGAEVTGVIAGAHTSGHVADGGVGVSVTGQYGSLTLNDDGSYSYELDNSNLAVQGLGDGESLTETFTYTITDADGDQSTATLTITVNGTNDGVTVDVPVNDSATTPDGNVNDHVVFESGLPNGSATNPDDLKVESSFTLVALDGLATNGAVVLTFINTNGNTQTLSLSKEQVEQLDSNPVTLLTEYGELVLNGYDQAVDGTITIDYEYTLQRAPEVDAVDVRDAIGIKVTDRDGDQDDSQSISIKIVDDAPQATDDTNTIAEDELSVTGNVRSNDQQGADGAEVTDITSDNASGNSATTLANGDLVIEGEYGTLTISPDGSYTYELDNTNLDVQGLHPNDVPLEEVFSYTLTDGDNDSDTAQLTISITGSNDGVTITVPDPTDPTDPNYPVVDPADPNDPARGNINDHVVFESGLAGGSATNADDTRVVSSFTLSALDGLDDTTAITIEVAGNTLTLSKAEVEALGTTSQSITTEYGELVLNDYTLNADGTITIGYQYNLTSAPDNTGGNGDSTDERIRITVNDRDTDSDSQDLVIRIIDDAPVARDDANEIDEDELSVIGNVITGGSTDDVADTEGADGATVTAIVSDNDSTSTATTNIDGDLVIVGEFGTLTISPDGSYTYALNNDNAEVNALKIGDTLTEQFSYTLTDIDGDSDTATLTITINGSTDGAPTIVPEDGNGDDPNDFLTNGHATVYERGLMSGDTSGSHITDGSITITAPDGLGSLVIGGTPVSLAQLAALDPADPDTHIEIDTPEGKLVLTEFDVTDAVGGVPTEGELKFSYELEQVQNTPADPTDPTAGRNNSEQIPLTVIDAGGEEADGTLTINIIDDTPAAVADSGNVTEGDTLTVDAANGVLENDTAGADGWAGTGAVVGVVAGDTNATSSGGVGGRIDGQYGYLILNADGSYEYVSTADAVTGNEVDVFTYTVRDGDGDLSHATLTINVADVTLAPETTVDSVNESGLSGGTTEGDSSHITSGQVNLPPGLEVVPGSGTTDHGTFTIDQDGNYSYTLTGNTNGDNTSDSFTYVTTDANGNTVENTVTINIVDDRPVARDDANSIDEDVVSVSGNVIGGGSASDDDVADSEGADGARVTDIASDNVAGNNVTTLPNGDRVIEGEYGTLTIRPDGFYTYELNNEHPEVNALKDDDDLQDVFTYTLTDTDNDSDTATLTITINGRTDGEPGVNIVDHNGNLEVGHNTIAEDATAPVTGEFTISAPDGLDRISVGGTEVTADDLSDLTANPVTINGDEGTLTLTGYDPDTGKVTYSYQQSGTSKDHTAGDDSVTESFPIIVTDKGGDSSAPSDLVILITDTAPVANPDTGSIDEDGPALEGNVLAGSSTNPDDVADDQGADTTTVTGVRSNNEPGNTATNTDGVLEIEGEYGTLTIQPDGSYTYELHDSAKVNALKDDDVRQEVFEYTIRDSDGDSDSTTLTITINGKTDGTPSITPEDDNGNGAIDGHNTVNESGLAGGSTAGDGSNIVDGTIQISAGDGLASITIGGQSFTLAELQALSAGSPSAAIAVEGGTLVLTGFTGSDLVGGVPTSGTLQYTYTLTGERTHSAQGNDDVLLDIPLSVTDAGNETVDGTLTIQVVDDVPTAVDDTADVAAGEFELVQNGNVLTNDTEGADGARVTSVTPDNGTETSVPGTGNLVIDGEYGKLTIHSDGSYSYQRNPGTEGGVEDVFEYTITDGDSDTSSASLTISIADSAPTVDIPSAGSATTTVHESGLPDGSDNIPDRATTSGSIEFNSADGLGTVSLGGHTLTETDQTFPTTGPAGSLTARYEYDPVTGKGSIHYSYTLEDTTDGDDTSVSFPVAITDQDGDAAPLGDLTIEIVNDTPTARPDEATVTEGDSVAGDVLGNDQSGADGWYDNGDAVVDVTSDNAPGNTASNVGGVLTIEGQYGTLTLNADGSYTYKSRANAVTGDGQDVFTYTVSDADGDETTATLTINISDVTGISRDTTGTVDEAGLPAGSDASSDKETTGGSLNLADGWTVDPSSVGDQSNGIGTLTINADGSYSYELTSRTEDVAGVEETDTFTYTAIDQYGNTVTNTVTITIIDDVPSVTLTGNALGEVQVDETTLGNSASADFSGAFTHHFGADGDSGDGLVYTLEVDTAATGLVDTLTGQDITLVMNGSVVEGQNEDGAVAFTISVDANGEVTLTQSRPLQHTDPNNHDDVLTLPAGSLKLTGTVTDGDGDTDSASVDIGGRFSFRDDGPTIGAAPAPGVVDEAYLTTGSQDGTAGLSTETGADLDVDFGADGQGSLVFSDDQVALRNWLDASGNTDITITGTGTSVLSGTRGGQEIFTVTLTVDASGQASYHFELKGALLHRSPTQDHELTFSYAAVDGDGDRANGTFRVDVKDDEPRSEITIDVDEDDANGPFTTSADATQDNTTISITDGGPALPGTPNGNDLDYDVGHGTVTVHEDGRITYTPNPDYSNHGSPDEFYVTVTEDDGTSQTIEVTVNVIPVADAPELTVDSDAVTTNEDEAIGLGLNAPKTTDDNDQNGSGTAGDNPERLGPITLSGFPAGAQLLDGTDSDSPLHTFDGSGSITIVISDNVDGPHFNGATGTLTLTTAQYEALKVLPPAESSANFTVDVSVTSYEVGESGNRLTVDVNGDPIDGAESTVSVTVNVQAVTDGIDLTIHNGDDNYVDADSIANAVTLPAFDEDGSINLKDYLQITLDETGDGNSGADTDGSEQRWFEVSGVPVGWTVDGVLITTPGQSVRVDIPNDYNGASPSLPDIVIEPPADFSGDLDGVRVTLHAQDTDSDGPNPLGAQISDSVYLNLRVNPQGGDVAADDVTTEEDTAVAFLEHVRVTDTGTGNEIITEVEFSLPDGWVLVDKPAGEGTDWEMTGSGTPADPYIITSLSGTDLEEVLGDFTVLPPAHSSKDEDIVVRVTSTDTNTVGGNSVPHSDWRDLTIKVEVTPKGERVENIGNPDRDTDGNNNPDLTMTLGRDYTTPGEEDEWFTLGQEAGFNLKDGWSNEDGRGVENGGTAGSGSEETFALLTPNLIAGDGSQADATGSEFRWGPNGEFSDTFDGTNPVEVPIEYLDTLQFKAAPHFSGMFEIKVQAKTVDYDEDYPGDESRADVQVSGDATLTNILIAPKADSVTATVTARVEGDEDERMPLSIRPKSSDPSESFEVDIDGVPDGATLWYDGHEITAESVGDQALLDAGITVTDNGDGTWKVEFADFDPDKGGDMEIQAPEDSNKEFDLTVTARSVDTLEVPGDPDSPYVSKSPDHSLNITVAPKGLADKAIIDLIDYDDPGVDPFTEADVDVNGGIALSDLIISAELKDNDGSEVLTFKISGLPEGFSIEGGTFMGGSGTGREWSLTKDQLANAKLVTPPNFNGSQTFELSSVTTENDGDSLTEQHQVEVRVSPSPEATINLGATLDEDISGKLDFSIEHRNGDTDEVLTEVWINASDLAGLDDLILTYGQGGQSLADAAADATNPHIVLEDGYYKLSGDAIDNIYAQGRENWHGDASFGVHYVITDPGHDGMADVSEGTDGTYNVTVNPITDQVTLAIPDADISMSGAGNTTITLDIGNTGSDYDGSEQLTRVILDNVPEGVVVVGTTDYTVDYVGGGTWVLIPTDGSFDGAQQLDIRLQVHGRAGGLEDHPIGVTVVTEDAGNGQETRASRNVTLSTDFPEGEPELPAIINQWEQTDFEPTEDIAFNLGQAIDASIDATGVVDSGFTVTLTDLPPGTEVSGMTRTIVDGQEVWSASGSGGDAELQALLDSITVTPPADFNHNQGSFDYNATLTTHTPSGGRAQESIRVEQEVMPVTDEADITITMDAVDEGQDLAIHIDVSNQADDPNWTLIDGKLYLTLDEPAGMTGGQLLDSDGNPLTAVSVTGVDGVTDGTYYVIDVGSDNTVDLTYRPAGPHVSGNITLEATVVGREANAGNTITTTTTQDGIINPVNSGYDFAVADVVGNEPATAGGKEEAIQLNVTGNGLTDTDGSESVLAVLLKNLPNDFLVFVGEDAASAELAELANNAGGAGTNTWLLGLDDDGNLPNYIAILPPKNWSGTLEDLELVVISGEDALSEERTDSRTFSVTVEPVANGLTIAPTPSFGKEGEIIGLNLNARFEDLRQAGTTDESVERATVELKGLGEHAAIYVDGDLIMDRVTYDEVNDVYTITGLTQDELDQLGFVQAAGDINNLQVRARTEEYDASTGEPVAGVEPSDWTHGTDDDWDGAAVTTNITAQFGTSGADELLWTGQGILNGRGGDDTVQLRFGESLEGSDLAAHLRNIEVIDLGIEGENQIGGLRVGDVLAMTDDRDTLKIFGDSEDEVSLDDPSAWIHAGQATEGDKTFNVYEGGGATLWVEQGVQGITID